MATVRERFTDGIVYTVAFGLEPSRYTILLYAEEGGACFLPEFTYIIGDIILYCDRIIYYNTRAKITARSKLLINHKTCTSYILLLYTTTVMGVGVYYYVFGKH